MVSSETIYTHITKMDLESCIYIFVHTYTHNIHTYKNNKKKQAINLRVGAIEGVRERELGRGW